MKVFGYGMICDITDGILTDNVQGDSLGHKAADKEFSPHLAKWLSSELGGEFQCLGDILPHHHQQDFVNCGIYAANTLEHALFKTPLISFSEVRPLRMAWFRKFVFQASTNTVC
jgi:hypothetical protein